MPFCGIAVAVIQGSQKALTVKPLCASNAPNWRILTDTPFPGLAYICVENIPRGIRVTSASHGEGAQQERHSSNHLHAIGVTMYVSYID
jgi:hypothetical protein